MKNISYSPFANLGDLSKYDLSTLNQIGSGMSCKVVEENPFKIVEWSNDNTVITIRFNEDGTFNQLISEVWKEENLNINYLNQ